MHYILRESINPDIKIDGKAPTYDQGIKFMYSTAAYDSFINEGFIPPEPQYTDKRKAIPEPSRRIKGKIKIKITRMYRQGNRLFNGQ